MGCHLRVWIHSREVDKDMRLVVRSLKVFVRAFVVYALDMLAIPWLDSALLLLS